MAEMEGESIDRRTVLIESGIALSTALAGCSQADTGGTPTTELRAATDTTRTTEDMTGTDTPSTTITPTSTDVNGLVESIESGGYYNANNAGTRTDPVFEHLFRSKQPLRLETDVGGVVASRPHDQGIELSVDLTSEDQFAGSGVYFGRWPLQDLREIDFTMTGDEMRLVIQLDLNGDGEFLDWQSANDDRERFNGFAGDDRAISTYLTDGPVTLDDAIFGIPPGGAKEPTGGLSVADLQDNGDIAVWIGAGVDHQDLDLPDSRQAVINEFTVTTT